MLKGKWISNRIRGYGHVLRKMNGIIILNKFSTVKPTRRLRSREEQVTWNVTPKREHWKKLRGGAYLLTCRINNDAVNYSTLYSTEELDDWK
jgi:uncharacterized protein YecE (DUF72 family)